jgi:hypothetical protein
MVMRTAATLIVGGLMTATIFAEEVQPTVARVRAESAYLRALIHHAADESPTVRALVDRLNRSDVVVYVRPARLSPTLDGRTGLLSVAGGVRYLVIELACPRSARVQSVTLGHELQHAVEIADAPEVVSARTLERFYSGIGIPDGDPGRRTFETAAARAVGERVRRELTHRLLTSDF